MTTQCHLDNGESRGSRKCKTSFDGRQKRSNAFSSEHKKYVSLSSSCGANSSNTSRALRQNSAALQVQLSRQLNLNCPSSKIRRSLLKKKKPPKASAVSDGVRVPSLNCKLLSVIERNDGIDSNVVLEAAIFEEWKDRESKALKRAQSQICSICHELYHGNIDPGENHSSSCAACHRRRLPQHHQRQSILSCGHIFHSACISSFEKFVGYENRFCPLCRFERYDAKPTNVGSLVRSDQAAIVVQKICRGWISRLDYRDRLSVLFSYGSGQEASNRCNNCTHSIHDECSLSEAETGKSCNAISASGKQDPEMFMRIRRKFYSRELTDLGNKVMNSIDRKESSISSLTGTIEESLAISRDMSILMEEQMKNRSVNGLGSSTRVHWDVILKAALGRNSSSTSIATHSHTKGQLIDCPICMCAMDISSCNKRSLTVLSCTHLFHTSCIEALEVFQQKAMHKAGASSIESTCRSRVCPVCRTNNYEKMQVLL